MVEGIEEGSIYPIEEMDRREKGTTETNGSEQREQLKLTGPSKRYN